MFYIYLHQNKVNNKIYVGFSENPEKRWREQKCSAYSIKSKNYNYIISKAIRKHGGDNFSHQIIEEFDTKEDALQAEVFWIETFRSNVLVYGPDCGYNSHKGGNCPPSQKNISPWNKGKTYHNKPSKIKQIKTGHKLRGLRDRTKLEPQIIKLYQDGLRYKDIIKQLGCGENTITRVIKRNNSIYEKRLIMALPNSSTISSVGAYGKIDNQNLPPANPTISWSNVLLAPAITDVANASNTNPRAMVRLTLAATTGALVLNNWFAVWMSATTTTPVIARTTTGVFTVTFPVNVSDQYSQSVGMPSTIPVNLIMPVGAVLEGSTPGFVNVSCSTNVVTINTFSANSNPSDLVGSVLNISVR